MSCKKEIKQDKQITLSFWQTMNEEETETLKSVISEFENINPNINIDMHYVPFSDARSKFVIANSSGTSADIFRSEISWISDFADKGFLLNLTDYISNSDRADYLEAAFNSSIYNGEVWSLPQVTDVLALFYNKKILKEAGYNSPPETLEELENYTLSIKEQLNIEGFYLRSRYYWNLLFLYSFGANMFGEDGSIEINSQNSIDSLSYVLDRRSNPFKYSIDPGTEYSDMMKDFITGKVAMIVNGPWATSAILNGPEFTDNSNLGVTVFPAGFNGKRGSPVGGHHYVISSQTKYPVEAYKFLQYINNSTNQELFAIKNNLLPTKKSTYKLDGIKNNDIIQSFLKQMEFGKSKPAIPESAFLYEVISKYYQKAWRGENSAKEVMINIEKEWQEIIGLENF